MSIANVNALKPAPFVRIKRFHYHDQFIEAPSGRSDPFYYGDLQGHEKQYLAHISGRGEPCHTFSEQILRGIMEKKNC